MLKPIEWTGDAVRLLDQTRLPRETVYVEISDEQQMHDAIRRLVVRGAPAIGVAAAFGAYLGVRKFVEDDPRRFFARLKEVCDYLATSRPTAVNLFWALERVQRVAREIAGEHIGASPACHLVRDVQDATLSECVAMLSEMEATIQSIGEHGLALLTSIANRTCGQQPSQIANVLTHCNAGGLAGTGALAPMILGQERGREFHVFVDETRPLLQGSRITAYELKASGVPVTLICDNMAAAVMSQKKVDACIVGADRIAANGDTANKIGTLAVAIAAKHFGIPFYVAAPTSTIDFATASGKDIPIEQRAADEVAQFGAKPTAPVGVDVFNPAFDVTPAELITAIITEHGIARPPFEQTLRDMMGRN
jgi:methylthioribose-1-phosphate isomerase